MNRTWLFSKKQDVLILLLPVWLCWGLCFLAPGEWHTTQLPLFVWVLIVLGIDVSHVWSTIFRTYLDKEEWFTRPKTLVSLPLIAFIVLFSLAYFSISFFWTCMAYLALFHFVKQQFGFMAYYKAISRQKINKRVKDKWVIYLGMLYPVFYWHISGDRDFVWFSSGDFFNFSSYEIYEYIYLVEILYWVILFVWLLEEIILSKTHKQNIQYGKILWVVTTWFNWYLGIVYFNSDLAFTFTNVVAHGIPYLALVIHYYIGKKRVLSEKKLSKPKIITAVFTVISSVLLLAFVEELLWDNFVNHEKGDFFQGVINYFASPSHNAIFLAVSISLLSLPQVTHYLLDAFIWKVNKKNPFVKTAILKP